MTDAEIKALMLATQTEGYPEDVRRLVHAVQAAERERCAKLCEDKGRELRYWWIDGEANAACQECAAAIRGPNAPDGENR